MNFRSLSVSALAPMGLALGSRPATYAYVALGVVVVFNLPWLVERWMDVWDRWRSGR